MITTGFLLVNQSTKSVEFHIASRGAPGTERYPLQPGAQTKVPTDPATASHDVHVTVDGVASVTLTTRNLNTRFTLTDESFWASEASPSQRRHISHDERAEIVEKIQALRTPKDIHGLSTWAQAAIRHWHSSDAADPYLLATLCSALASYSLGDSEAQETLVQQCALAALRRSERLTVLEEVSFALHLAEPANGKQGLLALPQLTAHKLRAWSRLHSALDPAFDPANLPKLNVAPPEKTGLPAGVAPEAVDDPRLRAEYQAAIASNRLAAAIYREQTQLRQAQARLQILLQRYLFRAYARPRHQVDALEHLLITHLPQAEHTTLLTDVLPSIKDSVAQSQPEVQQLPIFQVDVLPRDNFAGRSLERFGIGEEIDIALRAQDTWVCEALGGVLWRVVQGDATLLANAGSGHATLKLGATPGTVRLSATVCTGPFKGTEVGALELTATPPTGATMSQAPNTGISHTTGTWSVGFIGKITLSPSDVSYAGVLFREGEALAIATNWLSAWNGLNHPLGIVHTITGCVVDCTDSVASGVKDPDPTYGIGEFTWPIPWLASVDNGVTWASFMTANHYATSDNYGRATISKAGAGPFAKNAADPTSHT